MKAAKGTLIYIVGNVLGSLAVLLLLAILSRMFSQSDFGIYAIAIAFFYLLTGFYAFGVVLRKELPQMHDNRERAAELICNTYFVAMLISIVIAAVAMLLSGFLAVNVYHNPAMAPMLELSALLIIFYSLFNLTLAALIAIDKVKQGTALYLIYALLQLGVATLLVVLGYGVLGAIAGLGIGLIVPSVIGIYWIARHLGGRFVGPRRAVMRHVLEFSVPVSASTIAAQVPPNLAILLLGAFATTVIVGNYNAAFRFGNFVNVILASISFILIPAFARAFSERDLAAKIGRIYNSSIYYTLLFLLPLVIYAVSVAQPLIYLLFGGKWTLAPLFFILIAIGSAIGMLNTYAAALQVSYGDTKKFMYYQLLSVGIEVALLFVLTPYFGAYGVIFALFILSQIIINVIYIRVLYKQFAFKHDLGPVARLIIPSVLLFVPLYLITFFLHQSKWALVANLGLTLLLFPPLLVLFGAVGRKNIEFIKDIAKSFRMGSLANYFIRYTELFSKPKSGVDHKKV